MQVCREVQGCMESHTLVRAVLSHATRKDPRHATVPRTCSVRARRNWLRVLPPIPVTNISPYASSFSRCATLGSITSPLAPAGTGQGCVCKRAVTYTRASV